MNLDAGRDLTGTNVRGVVRDVPHDIDPFSNPCFGRLHSGYEKFDVHVSIVRTSRGIVVLQCQDCGLCGVMRHAISEDLAELSGMMYSPGRKTLLQRLHANNKALRGRREIATRLYVMEHTRAIQKTNQKTASIQSSRKKFPLIEQHVFNEDVHE